MVIASHLVRFSYSSRRRAFLLTSSYRSSTGSSTSLRLGWAMGTTCGEGGARDEGRGTIRKWTCMRKKENVCGRAGRTLNRVTQAPPTSHSEQNIKRKAILGPDHLTVRELRQQWEWKTWPQASWGRGGEKRGGGVTCKTSLSTCANCPNDGALMIS